MSIEFWKIIHDWQDLIGAFLGVIFPIFFWLVIEYYNNRKKKIENFYYLEKTLINSMNTAAEANKVIKDFIDNRLEEIIECTEDCSKNKRYSIATSYFPSFYIHTIDKDITNVHTGSGYIDNEIAKVFMMSNDFVKIIDDLGGQFKNTIEDNKLIATNKLNGPEVQCRDYVENIRHFREVIDRELIDRNIPEYLRFLVCARTALHSYNELGFRWKYKFAPNFKFFKNKKEYKDFKLSASGRVDAYLEKKREKNLEDIRKQVAEITETYLKDMKAMRQGSKLEKQNEINV